MLTCWVTWLTCRLILKYFHIRFAFCLGLFLERMLMQNLLHGNNLILKRMHFHTNSFAQRLVLPQRQKSTIQWVSQWEIVCISHQSDWIYYKQPIKFLVVKVNGMWEDLIDLIRIQFGTTKYFSFYKRGRSIHILGLHQHFLWVRLRILVVDEMSLELLNSTWTSCMQMKRDTFIFGYKGNLILLFFTRSKFN